MTKNDILNICKEQNVQYIRLQFTDMLGFLKNVEVPVGKLDDVLDNKIIFDGSSIEGFVRIQEADMFLYPDLNTWLVLEWEECNYGKVARLICDIYTVDGKPFEGDPRSLLKKQLSLMNKEGFTDFNIGFEPEFFLFKLENGKVTLEPNDNGGYFDMSPIDGAEHCRRDIVLELSRLGFEMEASHHEVAPGQHEINFKFANALEACDNVQTFKIIVKNTAKKYNLHATFMPKPIATVNGNGMHLNCSLATKDGNAFYDESNSTNQLSETCLKFISGVLSKAKEFTLITNPTVNSYKRLVKGFEAPCYVSWSDQNRSTMIRIPASKQNATRIEVRSVDPASNPYLAVASVLAAGLEGVKGNVSMIPSVNCNLFAISDEERVDLGVENLPQSLKEATLEFSNSEFMKSVVGEHLFNKIIEAKQLEWNDYAKTIHDWEIKKYLTKL